MEKGNSKSAIEKQFLKGYYLTKKQRGYLIKNFLIINICLIMSRDHLLKTKKFNHIPFDGFCPRILVKSDSLFTNIKINMFSPFKFHVYLFTLNLNKFVFLSKFFIYCLILQNKKSENEKNIIYFINIISIDFNFMRKRRRKPIL